MELSDVLRKVRAMVARAEHPSTPPEEADTARRMADELMTKWSVDQAMLDASRPLTDREIPDFIEVEIGDYSDIIGYVGSLAGYVAHHTRTYVRNYTAYRRDPDTGHSTWYSKVYGFRSDLAYFEILFTQLRLHMLGALLGRFDPKKTLGENVYDLHRAGYNWLEIASLDGWFQTYGKEARYNAVRELDRWRRANPDTKVPANAWIRRVGTPAEGEPQAYEVKGRAAVGGHYQSAYRKECAARHEAPEHIAPTAGASFRKSVASGYVNKIWRMLRAVQGDRAVSTELVLADRSKDLMDWLKQEFPKDFEPSKRRGGSGPGWALNETAYRRGVDHAATADVSGRHVGHVSRAVEGK